MRTASALVSLAMFVAVALAFGFAQSALAGAADMIAVTVASATANTRPLRVIGVGVNAVNEDEPLHPGSRHGQGFLTVKRFYENLWCPTVL